MCIIKRFLLAVTLLLCWLAPGNGFAQSPVDTEGSSWYFGFGARQIIPDENSAQPLYIAGYNNGMEITGVLDYCQARALWLDTGAEGVLLIGVDCIALDSGAVERIRNELADIPNCASVNVYATHTHAGPDTLGLWGPVGVDGKNDAYMDALIRAAVEAAREATANRQPGTLRYGWSETEDLCSDSRAPLVYEEKLYQLRFVPQSGGSGVRLLFFGAHAESLRSRNTLLSRDYPGLLCDQVEAATGDRAMYLPGAVGGLVMTKVFVADADAQAVQNLEITAGKLTSCALSIQPESERLLTPRMALSTQQITVPLENPVFLMYAFLGIVENHIAPADCNTGYAVQSELSVLLLDDVALALIPGEIFPELVYGCSYSHATTTAANPRPLLEIAQAYGVQELLIIGLANDELGYIVPPSDFLVHTDLPYIKHRLDKWGNDHYEETNSVGPSCAVKIAEAFETILRQLTR